MEPPNRGAFSSFGAEMNRNLSLRNKAAQWAVWVPCSVPRYFSRPPAPLRNAFGTDVPAHSAQRVRAGATSAADTLLSGDLNQRPNSRVEDLDTAEKSRLCPRRPRQASHGLSGFSIEAVDIDRSAAANFSPVLDNLANLPAECWPRSSAG